MSWNSICFWPWSCCTPNTPVLVKWEQANSDWETQLLGNPIWHAVCDRICVTVLYMCVHEWIFTNSQSENEADDGGDEDEELIEHGWLCPVNSTMKIILTATEKYMWICIHFLFFLIICCEHILTTMLSKERFASQQFRNTGMKRFRRGG